MNYLFLLSVFLLVSSIGFSQKPLTGRPNILFIIADDWSYPHAGAYGDRVIRTPNIDRMAREGALFNNAYCASPSCSPSRAAILTGRFPHQLQAGANLWGYLPRKYLTYTQLLEQSGYSIGLTRKGWGPGNFEVGGYAQNPAGPSYKDFASFLTTIPKDKPFCFWFGTSDPHRPYEIGSGARSGLKASDVKVPGWLPDTDTVRNDILDYYFEIERLDRELGEMLSMLEEAGQLDNTLVVITSDNGMPFPRAKANLYDAGTRMPLIMRWKGKINAGQKINAFVSLTDLAPTFLQIAGQKVPDEMVGVSLWPLINGEKTATNRNRVFVERERHANVRKEELGYPSRAIRTDSFLYIRNYHPERWPSGDPDLYHSVGPYGDTDDSPSKQYILQNKAQQSIMHYFNLCFAKRPMEELYNLQTDPDQVNNLARDPKFTNILNTLAKGLTDWQAKTEDPRVGREPYSAFDTYPYFGPPVKGAPSTYKPNTSGN
jgi:N-sulfoglucosamine sulfohydrolase